MKKLVQMMAWVSALTVVAFVAAPSAFALGFRNPDQDARATGQGEAFVAQADDASAIYYNPAGLTQVAGTQVSAGGYLLFRDIRFDGGPGNHAQMNDPAFIPHLYVATDLGLEKWRFGIGANTPFGNAVDWGKNSPFQFALTRSSLTVESITPTVAYQVNDRLSLGAGVNIYRGETELHFNYSPFIPGSTSRFRGSGDAVGATAGLMWRIIDPLTLGVVYRSPFAINFDGGARINNAGGFTTAAPAHTGIDFPQSVAAGLAYRPIPRLKLEIDVDWTNWETLNTVRLHTADPTISADPRSTLPFKWLDSFYYEFGAQYELDDHWVVRGGYIFSENSVPTSTFSPNLPDSNRHVFSVGLGFDSKKPVLFSKIVVLVDIVYQYALSDDRTIPAGKSSASPFVDGTWKSDSHAVMLTNTLKF